MRRLGQDVASYLNVTGAGNDPGTLLALAEFHRGTTKLSKADAQKELTKIRASKEFQRGDRYVVDPARLVSAIAYRGESRELPMPAKQRPLAPSATKQELTRLQADPAYIRRGHPGHKAVVARVAELYAVLYPEG